jgi:hypothetical protein
MRWFSIVLVALLGLQASPVGQEKPLRFGGDYAELGARRQHLVDNWVARVVKVTRQQIEPAAFYDDLVNVSTKTTFDAVTHALMTTPLTDEAGASLGDALSIVGEVDAVRGEVAGARGDHQFRIYVLLAEDAVDRLKRSREFKRGADNAIYHKGYPINYREQGGAPSIQVSIALDDRHADIDVDYRSSSFPLVLFNGHLTSSNSDVRAGNNFDRHVNRWEGFQNWWRSFFGVRERNAAESAEAATPLALPKAPRAGKAPIDVAVSDFLQAWLVEGDIVAAMGYISERSYACLARNSDDPASFDRGVAPFQLMMNLKAAHDAAGAHESLDGLIVGTRFTIDGLKVVQQPHHAQFVLYSVPDDIAANFDCENELGLGKPPKASREYGHYYGATFYLHGSEDLPVALLWSRVGDYWKLVSWKAGVDEESTPAPDPVPEEKSVRVPADPTFVAAARSFLENWLVKKDLDAAFRFIAPQAYACYNLERGSDAPEAVSDEDAGRKLRAGLESVATKVGRARSLGDVLSAVEPVHPAVRVMDHAASSVFTLTSVPDALADSAECAARARGDVAPHPLPLVYGQARGTLVRFATHSGDAPVLRLLWRKQDGAWRITSYGIEMP